MIVRRIKPRDPFADNQTGLFRRRIRWQETTHTVMIFWHLVDALRISDAEWYACVQEMDLRAMQQKGFKEKRLEPRKPYRNIAKIIVSVRSYDGLLQQFKVRAYDLSRIGLGFLHGAYVYEGSQVDLLMQHHVNGMTRIPAPIISCEHVKKRIHQVGARFDEPIDLEDFLMSEAG